MPAGAELNIGYLRHAIRMLVIEDDAALSCSSTSDQPAVHITPSAAAVRG
jgi:hypothetical protein